MMMTFGSSDETDWRVRDCGKGNCVSGNGQYECRCEEGWERSTPGLGGKCDQEVSSKEEEEEELRLVVVNATNVVCLLLLCCYEQVVEIAVNFVIAVVLLFYTVGTVDVYSSVVVVARPQVQDCVGQWVGSTCNDECMQEMTFKIFQVNLDGSR